MRGGPGGGRAPAFRGHCLRLLGAGSAVRPALHGPRATSTGIDWQPVLAACSVESRVSRRVRTRRARSQGPDGGQEALAADWQPTTAPDDNGSPLTNAQVRRARVAQLARPRAGRTAHAGTFASAPTHLSQAGGPAEKTGPWRPFVDCKALCTCALVLWPLRVSLVAADVRDGVPVGHGHRGAAGGAAARLLAPAQGAHTAAHAGAPQAAAGQGEGPWGGRRPCCQGPGPGIGVG